MIKENENEKKRTKGNTHCFLILSFLCMCVQSERFYSALKGHGVPCRLVILPLESHGFSARESIMHVLWEMDRWLEKHFQPKDQPTTASPESVTTNSTGSGNSSSALGMETKEFPSFEEERIRAWNPLSLL